MSDNSKPTQNSVLSFEQWLGKAERLDAGATYGPWRAISAGDKGNTLIEAEYVDVLNHDEMGHGHLRHEYAWMTKEDADWIAWSRTALPQAVAALRATLDMHAKIVTNQHIDGPTAVCEQCSEDRMFAIWPCPTVAAITEALGGA